LRPLSSPLAKARAIMEYCWNARSSDPYQEIDWVDAMRKLGLTLVLL
jgi:hypothetical protein